jgi:DNA polymerase
MTLPLPPPEADLATVRAAAAACTNCELYKAATQTVFGEGPEHAPLMLVGEVPGDREDIAGRPFVGPAGRVLAEALLAAGIDREGAYVTNAVKHFKFVRRGKLRLHQTPLAGEIRACAPWLEREIEIVDPHVIVALGATAGRALAGPAYRVTRQRGEVLSRPDGRRLVGTIHPSALLRIEDAAEKAEAIERFTQDLAVAARLLAA